MRKIIGIVALVSIAFGGISHAALVNHWTLDELDGNSQFVDSVSANVGTNNGTLNGDAALDTAVKKIGAGAAVFDGDGDYVDVGLIEKVGDTALTIAAWINMTSYSGDDFIFGNTGNSNAEYAFKLNGGKLVAAVNTVDGWFITDNLAANTVKPDGWTHVAMVYDGTSIIRYINGIQTGTIKSATGAIARQGTSDVNASIGSINGSNPDSANSFNGRIDEVRVYDTALSASEIETLAAGLVNHWKLDALVSDKFPDEVGPYYGESRNDTLTVEAGKIGIGSVSFDDSDVVMIGYYGKSGLSKLTLSAWIKLVDNGGAYGIFGNNGENFYVQVSGLDLQARFYTSDGVGDYNVLTQTSGDQLAIDAWTHVVMVWDSSSVNGVNMYIDGVVQSLNLAISGDVLGYVAHSTAQGGIGAINQVGSPFLGNIDDVSVRQDAMTADEIKCLFDVGNSSVLGYDASQFDLLRQVHEGQLDSILIGGLTWIREIDLTEAAGLSGSSDNYTLVMDEASNTGLGQPILSTLLIIQ
jgi:hypothetical protein